jgi:hypothetical protein
MVIYIYTFKFVDFPRSGNYIEGWNIKCHILACQCFVTSLSLFPPRRKKIKEECRI